jgi:hypothetical protein
MPGMTMDRDLASASIEYREGIGEPGMQTKVVCHNMGKLVIGTAQHAGIEGAHG